MKFNYNQFKTRVRKACKPLGLKFNRSIESIAKEAGFTNFYELRLVLATEPNDKRFAHVHNLALALETAAFLRGELPDEIKTASNRNLISVLNRAWVVPGYIKENK